MAEAAGKEGERRWGGGGLRGGALGPRVTWLPLSEGGTKRPAKVLLCPSPHGWGLGGSAISSCEGFD